MSDHTFPQPSDPNDAENFAAWLGRQELSNFVEFGLNINNVSGGTYDLSSGKFHVYTQNPVSASNNGNAEDRYGTSFYSYVDQRTDLSYTTGEMNYVYITLDKDTDDNIIVETKDTDSPPTDFSLKLGEIDGSTDTATEVNRRINTYPNLKNNSNDVFENASEIDFKENIRVIDDDGTATVNVGAFTETEEASTFNESDITVSLNNTDIVNDSVELINEPEKLDTVLNTIEAFSFYNNGDNALIADDSSIYDYSLSDAYDLGTVTSNNSYTSSQSGDIVHISENSGRFYTITDNGYTYEYSVSSGSLSLENTGSLYDSDNNRINPEGASFNDTGDTIFVNTINNTIYKYDLSRQNDPTSASYNVVYSNTHFDYINGDIRDIEWADNGNEFYYTVEDENLVLQYSASTAYDPSSSSLSKTKEEYTEDDDGNKYAPTSVTVSNSGARLHIGDNTGNMYGYELTTPYQISSIRINYTTEPTAGDVLVEFPQPSYIYSWDIANFVRTLDGETVTIDIEDDSGNVLKSNISSNEDISDIDKSKNIQLRATLNRNSTYNNPKIDYLARRYIR